MLYFSAPFPLFSCLCCWRFQLLSIYQHSRILPPWHLLPPFSFCVPGFPSMFLPPALSSVLPASLSFVLLTRCSSSFEEPAFWPQPRIQQLLKLRATCNIQAREGSSEKRPRHNLFSKVHVLAMEQGPALFSVIGLLPSTNGSVVRLPEWGLKVFPLPLLHCVCLFTKKVIPCLCTLFCAPAWLIESLRVEAMIYSHLVAPPQTECTGSHGDPRHSSANMVSCGISQAALACQSAWTSEHWTVLYQILKMIQGFIRHIHCFPGGGNLGGVTRFVQTKEIK